jgi:hypothetical protein
MTLAELGTDVFALTSSIGEVEVEMGSDRAWAEVSWVEVPEGQRGNGNGAKLLAVASQACVERGISLLRSSITLPAALCGHSRVFSEVNLKFYELPDSATTLPNEMTYEEALQRLVQGRADRDALVSAGEIDLANESETYVHVGVDLTDGVVLDSLRSVLGDSNIVVKPTDI